MLRSSLSAVAGTWALIQVVRHGNPVASTSEKISPLQYQETRLLQPGKHSSQSLKSMTRNPMLH